MFGDIVILIKNKFKECFCIHEYTIRIDSIGGNQIFKTITCAKCGRKHVEGM